MLGAPSDSPAVHYDRVTSAWRHLMGESFHYGYFETPDADLDEATRALTRRMAERARLEAGQRVLDIGCGIGDPARFLARTIGCRVTGISTSEVGISLARAESAAAGLTHLVSFEVRDGMRSGFPDASFDRIWILESSHLMPDKAALLRDAARVLVPGGRLGLCDIILRRDLPIREVVQRARELDLLRRVFGRARMETLATYRRLLAEAGLAGIETQDVSAATRPTLLRWQERADRYRDEVVSLVTEPAWAEFRAACGVLRQLWDEDVLGYGLVAAEKPRLAEDEPEPRDRQEHAKA